MDISRAFDKVWHAVLIHKLRLAGISGDILEWLKDYLRNRQQGVCINGQFSCWADILAGVPHGSVLGPLLFLVFINDLTKVVRHTQIRLFADEWLVSFNVPKTKSMIISNKIDKHNHPQVSMHNSVLEDVAHHRHLGLVLSNNLGWTNHIDEVYEEVRYNQKF